jgi:hypothetical protein
VTRYREESNRRSLILNFKSEIIIENYCAMIGTTCCHVTVNVDGVISNSLAIGIDQMIQRSVASQKVCEKTLTAATYQTHKIKCYPFSGLNFFLYLKP